MIYSVLLMRLELKNSISLGMIGGAAIGWSTVMSAPQRILSWTALSIPHPLAFLTQSGQIKHNAKKSRYILFLQIPWIPEFLLVAHKFFSKKMDY